MTEAPSFLPLLFLFEGNQSVSCNSLLERKYVRSFFFFSGIISPFPLCVKLEFSSCRKFQRIYASLLYGATTILLLPHIARQARKPLICKNLLFPSSSLFPSSYPAAKLFSHMGKKRGKLILLFCGRDSKFAE